MPLGYAVSGDMFAQIKQRLRMKLMIQICAELLPFFSQSVGGDRRGDTVTCDTTTRGVLDRRSTDVRGLPEV